MDKLLRIETTTQSVSNHSSQLYYTTFSLFSKINITKFQKINIDEKKLKKSDLNKNGVIVRYLFIISVMFNKNERQTTTPKNKRI